MLFDIKVNTTINGFTLEATSHAPSASMIDWCLVLQEVEVLMKVKFAEHVGEKWAVKKGFTPQEKAALVKEIMKLEGEHPNYKRHEEELNRVLHILVDKLDVKTNRSKNESMN